VVGSTKSTPCTPHPSARLNPSVRPGFFTNLLAGLLEAFPDLCSFHRGVRFLPIAHYGPREAARHALGGMGVDHFSAEHEALFEQVAGSLLFDLGYANDPRGGS